MTREERNQKLKKLITCYKCEVSGKCCDDDCPTQYEAGNMGEIIENLEAISKLLEQKSETVTDFADRCRECGAKYGKLLERTRWIPVSERLPKAGEYIGDGDVAKYYLVQNEYGDMMVARYTHSEYWEQIYKLKPIGDEIVAWRELPEPYVPDINVGNRK